MGEHGGGFRVERDPVGEKRVRLITAHPERCAEYARRSVGVAALFNPERGFMGAAELAQKAIEEGKSIYEVVEAEKEAGGQ